MIVTKFSVLVLFCVPFVSAAFYNRPKIEGVKDLTAETIKKAPTEHEFLLVFFCK